MDRLVRMELQAQNEMRNMMVRVRQQMNDLLNRFPGIRNGNSSGDLPDFPRIGDFPRLDIDLGKGNTTSVTKIIDGHKVVINQTEYHKDDELGSSFFKVRIIDVQPQDTATEKDAEEVKPISTVSKDRESVENTVENEILKNKEVGTNGAPEKLATLYQQQSIENFDIVDSPSRFVPRFVPMEANSNWNDFSRIEPIDDNSLDFEPIRDLSRDTYVNEIMANSGATMNPDAELIEVVPYKSNIVPIGDNGVNFKPIGDLSRDTYVNEIMANSGATVNPDAEIIDFVPQNSNYIPRTMEKYQYSRRRK